MTDSREVYLTDIIVLLAESIRNQAALLAREKRKRQKERASRKRWELRLLWRALHKTDDDCYPAFADRLDCRYQHLMRGWPCADLNLLPIAGPMGVLP